jgi:hypothetical protein
MKQPDRYQVFVQVHQGLDQRYQCASPAPGRNTSPALKPAAPYRRSSKDRRVGGRLAFRTNVPRLNAGLAGT